MPKSSSPGNTSARHCAYRSFSSASLTRPTNSTFLPARAERWLVPTTTAHDTQGQAHAGERVNGEVDPLVRNQARHDQVIVANAVWLGGERLGVDRRVDDRGVAAVV